MLLVTHCLDRTDMCRDGALVHVKAEPDMQLWTRSCGHAVKATTACILARQSKPTLGSTSRQHHGGHFMHQSARHQQNLPAIFLPEQLGLWPLRRCPGMSKLKALGTTLQGPAQACAPAIEINMTRLQEMCCPLGTGSSNMTSSQPFFCIRGTTLVHST